MIKTTKELPILFKGEMVNAILDGRKTQTRRLVKPQPKHLSPVMPRHLPNGTWKFVLAETGMGDGTSNGLACPYGSVGDLLYVRETFALVIGGGGWCTGDVTINYKADGKQFHMRKENIEDYGRTKTHHDDWRRSIHMPKWVARIWLEVVSVRVEQLQEIRWTGARAEGIKDPRRAAIRVDLSHERNPVRLFRELWDSINGKDDPWDSNPWVWVVEFKKINKEKTDAR